MRAAILASICLVAAIGLSGCAAYTVASTAVDVTATVVGTTAHVAGAIISYPFSSSDSDKKERPFLILMADRSVGHPGEIHSIFARKRCHLDGPDSRAMTTWFKNCLSFF